MGIPRSAYRCLLDRQYTPEQIIIKKKDIPIYMAPKKSKIEIEALNRIKGANLPEPTPEYYFARPRRFRFDLAYPDKMIAIELEGGVWINGRHNRGTGFINDCEKYNLACLLGWKVLRYPSGKLETLTADLTFLLTLNK